ncbi:MAG: caspase family protein [Pseudomonadota bacterium]
MMKKRFSNRFPVGFVLFAIVVMLGGCATNAPVPVDLGGQQVVLVGSSSESTGFYVVVEKVDFQWTIKRISNSPLERINDSEEVIFVGKDFGYVSPAFYGFENVTEIVPVVNVNNLFECSILSDEDEVNEGYSPCGITELAKTSIGNTIGSRLRMALITMGLALVATPTYLKSVNREVVGEILKETDLIMAAKAFDLLFVKAQSSPDFLRFKHFKPTANDPLKIAAFSPPLADGIILWNAYTGKEIVKFFSSAKNDKWVAITPEGFYNASGNSDKYLKIQINNENYRLDQYKATHHRSDIVRWALDEGDSGLAMSKAAAEPITTPDVQPPKIWFVVPENEHKTEQSSIEVTVETEEMVDSLDAITFTVNQRPVATEKGKRVRPITAGVKVKTHIRQIPLQVGRNWIAAEARGRAGAVERSRSLLVIRESVIKQQPDLYYLGIGVAEHLDMPLKYPVKDVKGLEAVFKEQEGKVYRRVLTKTLTERNATRGNLVETVNSFFEPAKPGDIAILFISGHGMNTEQGYYFLTYDADPDQLENTGASWKIFNAISHFNAHVLLLVDTCHAGNISGNSDWQARASADPNQFSQEANLHNVLVFASSSGAGVSQEDDSWGHGAFTRALIDGLSGGAADNKGMVYIDTLRRYVSTRVQKLTGGHQRPVIPRFTGSGDFFELVLAKK